MKKKFLLSLSLLFLTIPFFSQATGWWAKFEKNKSSQDPIIEALELAVILEPQPEFILGNLFESSTTDQTKDEKDGLVVQRQELSLTNKINALNKNIKKIEQDSLNPIKKHLNAVIKLLNNPSDASNKNSILESLKESYKLFFTGLQLNKGIFNTKKPYLRINYAQFTKFNKADMAALEDIKDILALLCLQYLEKYDNDSIEISFNRQGSSEQKLKLSPLRWAYFTAHAGKDFTENQLLNNYSKPYIMTIFNQVTEKANLLLKKIESAAQDKDLNRCKFLQNRKDELSKLYQLLFLKKQTNDKYFQLSPEFQDAFPVIKRTIPGLRPELPKELAIALTNLAEIWLKLINNKIVDKEETVLLSYPETIYSIEKATDPIEKTTPGISAINWMHATGSAGYDTASYNIPYENLIAEPTLLQNYKDWAKKLPEKARGFFDKFIYWSDSSFDPSIFNN